MTAPSNANTSGLKTAGHVVWWKAGGVNYYPEGEAFTVSKSCRVEPLVTAASAQAAIDAAEARADRLAKALERTRVFVDACVEVGELTPEGAEDPTDLIDAIDAALQQEG